MSVVVVSIHSIISCLVSSKTCRRYAASGLLDATSVPTLLNYLRPVRTILPPTTTIATANNRRNTNPTPLSSSPSRKVKF